MGTRRGATAEETSSRLSTTLVVIMAVATGLAVANNYYAQPLLAELAADLSLSSATAGLVVTFAQVGYALGLVFVLPLGDLLTRRRLLVTLGLLTAAALGWLATAGSAGALLAAAATVGVVSVQAQILVPFAAHLASEHQRGKVVGTVMSGLLLGVLLARTAAGYLADAGGWRLVYLAAAAAMAAQAAVLAWRLPCVAPTTQLGYPALLHSVLALVRTQPVLRLRAAYGAASFAAFSVLWTSLAFLLAGPPYHYSTGVIGLFGLVGAAGAGMASIAGRLADRGWASHTTTASCLVLAICWLPIWLGAAHLGWLLVGIVAFDLAAQGLHITNQSQIYRLDPYARSRLTSAYMTAYFLGGAAGSAASASAWHADGWTAVAATGAGFSALAVLLLLAQRNPTRHRR